MKTIRLMFNFFAVSIVCLACSSLANAQATRTWVSGVGDDANPCSRTAPCKTFAGAISKTAACGEISVLDPGGFGAVTITKAITINGDGTLAGILNAGTNGIIVNAGVNDDVIIRNISINGACTGLNGIRFLGGRHLHVENCTIYDQTQNGIDMVYNLVGGTGQLSVANCSFTGINGVGIRGTLTAGNGVSAQITHSRINRAGFGFDMQSGSGTIANSAISHVVNQAIVGENNGTVVNAVGCVLDNNGTGVSAFSSGVTINVANCDIFNNTTGVNVAAGATGNRFGNSRVINNTNNVVGTFNLQSNQ